MLLRLSRFGGLVPRALDDALPGDAAGVATNLAASTYDFRPVGADTTIVAATGITDPLTIYRHQRTAAGALNTDFTASSTWRYSAIDVSIAKYPNNDDTTDRHVLTYNDGSSPPVWIDATGVSRQLGVPKPTTAPAVTLNEVDEFTSEDRASDLDAARQTVVDAIKANATPVWRGATHPGTGTTGYLDQTTANGFTAANDAMMVRGYRLTAAGGAISDDYTALPTANFSWIFDPLLPGFPATLSAAPSWAGAAAHQCITLHAYGLTYDVDTGAVSTAIAAIAMPGGEVGEKLLTAGQVTDFMAKLAEYTDPAGDIVKPKLDALNAKVIEVKVLLDGGAQSSVVAQRAAFYALADVAAAKTAAIANAAEDIWSTAWNIAHSSLPAENAGPGNGS
jgi:hypothetical protein